MKCPGTKNTPFPAEITAPVMPVPPERTSAAVQLTQATLLASRYSYRKIRLVWRPLPMGSRLERRVPNSLCDHEFDGVLVRLFSKTSPKTPIGFPPALTAVGMKIIDLSSALGSILTLSV